MRRGKVVPRALDPASPAGRLSIALRRSHPAGVRLLGCTLDEAVAIIKAKFKPGMTWDNWGRTTWHLDHIKARKLVDFSQSSQVAAYCNIANLQPLRARDNLSKRARKATIGADGEVIVHSKREIRVAVLLLKAGLKELDDWQFANRMRTRSDAIRAMMRVAIAAKKPAADQTPA